MMLRESERESQRKPTHLSEKQTETKTTIKGNDKVPTLWDEEFKQREGMHVHNKRRSGRLDNTKLREEKVAHAFLFSFFVHSNYSYGVIPRIMPALRGIISITFCCFRQCTCSVAPHSQSHILISSPNNTHKLELHFFYLFCPDLHDQIIFLTHPQGSLKKLLLVKSTRHHLILANPCLGPPHIALRINIQIRNEMNPKRRHVQHLARSQNRLQPLHLPKFRVFFPKSGVLQSTWKCLAERSPGGRK